MAEVRLHRGQTRDLPRERRPTPANPSIDLAHGQDLAGKEHVHSAFQAS